MGQPSVQKVLAAGMTALATGRYSIAASYVVCFYDWIISLDEEVAFIHSAPWNVVKCVYIFCRYFPLAIAPFHFWGFLGDHEQRICELSYHALYACFIPMILSAEFILMLRAYAFSGRKKKVLAVLSIAFLTLAGVMIWVTSKELSLVLTFVFVKRSGCFAISDQPTSIPVQGEDPQTFFFYHLGTVFILTTFFDFLNMFIVVRHCIRERGILVYAIMTILNVLTIGTFFSGPILKGVKGVGPWFAYILPSALSCRLVLLLRRQASPTETELRVQYSHVIDEALEMTPVGSQPEEGFIFSTSTDPHAQLDVRGPASWGVP